MNIFNEWIETIFSVVFFAGYYHLLVKKEHKIIHCILGILYSIYLAGILHFTLLHRVILESRYINFFYFHIGTSIYEMNEIFYNILLFIPMGFLTPVCFKNMKLNRILFQCFSISFGVETIQLVFQIGFFDINDLVNNVVGGYVGYLFYIFVEKELKNRGKYLETLENHENTNKGIKEFSEGLFIYPQLLKNVKVNDKTKALNDKAFKELVDEVAKELGDEGRILVIPSGTEPLIRVMVEAKTDDLCAQYVDRVVEFVEKNNY